MSERKEESINSLLRRLPQVGAVLQSDAAQPLLAEYPREMVKQAVEQAIDECRQAIRAGQVEQAPDVQAVVVRAGEILRAWLAPRLRPVINATGVIIHTGLGRAPLPPAAVEAMVPAASGYCNLEVRLEDGRRGHRDELVNELICRVTGAEAATVVNNNAGAVMLVLAELAKGREVIVSRGQLIEIGGSFRLPEIMAQSGCILVEVGTTNRTRLSDYEKAISDQTAAILVAHHSNYRIIGFHAEPELAQLVQLAHRHGLPLIHDLGSGALVDTSQFAAGREPMAQESIAAGADVVCFSADKLLGGPQAGVICGRADLIASIRANPLARALRMDKLRLAALEATLRLYLDPEHVWEQVPVLAMMAQPLERVRDRAARVYEALLTVVPAGTQMKIVEVPGRVGGGSLPEYDLPSAAVMIWPPEGLTPEHIARRLRTGDSSVFPRIAEDAVVLDMRTVRDDQVSELVEAVAAAMRQGERANR